MCCNTGPLVKPLNISTWHLLGNESNFYKHIPCTIKVFYQLACIAGVNQGKLGGGGGGGRKSRDDRKWQVQDHFFTAVEYYDTREICPNIQRLIQ